MIHGSTDHAPRSFAMPQVHESKPNPMDVEDFVINLRRRRNNVKLQIKSRLKSLDSVKRAEEKVRMYDTMIEEFGFPAYPKRGRRRKR